MMPYYVDTPMTEPNARVALDAFNDIADRVTLPCGCPAYDPVHNDHTEAEHSDCGNLHSYGGGTLPCGGCDSCMSAQVAYWQRRRESSP